MGKQKIKREGEYAFQWSKLPEMLKLITDMKLPAKQKY